MTFDASVDQYTFYVGKYRIILYKLYKRKCTSLLTFQHFRLAVQPTRRPVFLIMYPPSFFFFFSWQRLCRFCFLVPCMELLLANAGPTTQLCAGGGGGHVCVWEEEEDTCMELERLRVPSRA
jgi:hypothetical protein